MTVPMLEPYPCAFCGFELTDSNDGTTYWCHRCLDWTVREEASRVTILTVGHVDADHISVKVDYPTYLAELIRQGNDWTTP